MKLSKFWQVLLFGMLSGLGVVGGEGGGAGAGAGDDDGGGAGDGGKGGAGGDGKDAKPSPSDAEAKLLKEVMQKKDALQKATTELTDLKTKLASFDGIDPVAVKALLAEQKKAEETQLEAKGEWERLKARMAEEHGKEVVSVKEQAEALRAQLAQQAAVIDKLSVGAQFSQSTFITEELTLTPSKARVVYGDYFDVAEDGSVVGFDKPRGSASRTALINGAGVNMPFDEALRKIVEADPEKDHVLKSKVRPGAGSDTKQHVKVSTKPAETDSMSKIAQGLKALGAVKA